MSRYLTNNPHKEIDAEAFYEWNRVIYNLVRNSEYDEISEFARSIKGIDEMAAHSGSILDYLADINNNLSGFSVIQIEEERIKAILILKSEEWKELIYSAEAHKYFDGAN